MAQVSMVWGEARGYLLQLRCKGKHMVNECR